MPQADPECGHAPGSERTNDLGSIKNRLWVARSVRQKNAVGLFSQYRFSARIRGHNGHPAIVIPEDAEDVALDSVIVGDDVVCRSRISPGVLLSRGHP